MLLKSLLAGLWCIVSIAAPSPVAAIVMCDTFALCNEMYPCSYPKFCHRESRTCCKEIHVSMPKLTKAHVAPRAWIGIDKRTTLLDFDHSHTVCSGLVRSAWQRERSRSKPRIQQGHMVLAAILRCIFRDAHFAIDHHASLAHCHRYVLHFPSQENVTLPLSKLTESRHQFIEPASGPHYAAKHLTSVDQKTLFPFGPNERYISDVTPGSLGC